MSILDIAEDPRYQIIAVAIANDDAVIMYKNVKKTVTRNLLIQAIEMLSGQLDSTEVTGGNPLPIKESLNVPAPVKAAS